MSGTHASGRRPKSVSEHQLRGTFQPSRHAGLGDPPVPPPGPVEKPARLSLRAALAWDRLAPLATQMGTLTRADVACFAVLCELQGTLEWASELKDRDPTKFSPKLEREYAAAIRPYFSLFGFDPVGRARLHLTPAPAAANPLQKFLARKPSKWADVLP